MSIVQIITDPMHWHYFKF